MGAGIMPLAACVVLVVSLGAAADVSQSFRFAFQQGQTADPEKTTPQASLHPAVAAQPAANAAAQPSADTPAKRAGSLTEASRMAIIRALSGEFVRAQASLPGGKDGTHVPANGTRVSAAAASQAAPVMTDGPKVMVVSAAPVIHKGDRVQITQIQFRSRSIEFQLNGGGYRPFHFLEHLHVDMAGPVTGGSSVDQPGQPVAYVQGQGATLFLDFDRPVPDVTPDEIKRALAPYMDFTVARSPAQQYAESLPPEFQQAIKDRMAVVGMNREMVLAAMGRPGRKVRERDEQGNETEDWIYGTPPDKTVFVTFQGDRVVRVRQFH
jgi:hypothetical protein